jgi:hypothetical protein
MATSAAPNEESEMQDIEWNRNASNAKSSPIAPPQSRPSKLGSKSGTITDLESLKTTDDFNLLKEKYIAKCAIIAMQKDELQVLRALKKKEDFGVDEEEVEDDFVRKTLMQTENLSLHMPMADASVWTWANMFDWELDESEKRLLIDSLTVVMYYVVGCAAYWGLER